MNTAVEEDRIWPRNPCRVPVADRLSDLVDKHRDSDHPEADENQYHAGSTWRSFTSEEGVLPKIGKHTF
jgi:hypothetical protein